MEDKDLDNLAIMVEYLHNHFQAGHDLSDPKLKIDLYTTLTDLHVVLDRFGPPPTAEQQLAWLVRATAAQGKQLDEVLVLLRDDVDDYPL